MKLKNFTTQTLWAFAFFAALSLLNVSCTFFNKGRMSSKNIPQSYGTIATKGSNVEAQLLYIDRYKGIAVREMERTGVPASIKLAQGILESASGKSLLSSQYNNHFGIKCHSDWQGERYYQEDDDKDPVTGQLIKSCFRSYKNGDESFIAHSEFLRDPRKVSRYGFLFQLDKKDYAGWASGLQRAGYATAPDYSDKLIRLIEDLQLNQYDNLGAGDVYANPTNNNGNRPDNNFPTNPPSNNNNFPTNTPSSPNTNQMQGAKEGNFNDVKFVRAFGGTTIEQLAGRYDVSVKKLREYNEEIGEPDRRLPEGTMVFLQEKRRGWRGEEKYYAVQQCETMYDISQKFGIMLTKLYSKNNMREGDQPAIGAKITLRRGWFERVDMPALRDTFNEWRKCAPQVMPNPNVNPNGQPATANRPSSNPSTPTTGSGEFGFDIQQGNQPTTTPQYPATNNPNPQPTYPATETTTYPSYPSQPTTTYPSSQPSTSNNSGSQPSTNYPSSESTYYPPSQPTTRPTTTTRPTPPASRPQTQPTQPASSGAGTYTVSQGETLWAISRKFNTTVDKLKALNGLIDNTIKPGQQLRVK